MRWIHTLAEPFCESRDCRCRTGVYAEVIRNPERDTEAKLRAIKIMNDATRLTHIFYRQHFPQRVQ